MYGIGEGKLNCVNSVVTIQLRAKEMVERESIET